VDAKLSKETEKDNKGEYNKLKDESV